LLITFLSVVAIAWYGIQSQRDLFINETALRLQARSALVERLILGILDSGDTTGIDRLCKEIGQVSSTRITLILPSGKVIADSDENPAAMDNHSNRPEVTQALKEGLGINRRYSYTINRSMLYVAIPLFLDDGTIRGILRTSIPLTSIEKSLSEIRMRMILSGLAIALLAALVSLYMSRRISLPLERLKEGAERFASGDLGRRLEDYNVEEIDGLAGAMNKMARQLDQRIRTIAEQRRENDAILTSMAEGVVAVDTDDRVIIINDTAANFFGVDAERAHGRYLHEVVRSVALQQLSSSILENHITAEAEIIHESESGRKVFQATGSILRDAGGESIGAVIVLNDVTKVRELENLRRDFVANASHELRTPITSIKGYVETLLDGAMNDAEDLKKFLEIINRHAQRLNSIVEDLLNLSRIEQGVGITYEESRIGDVIKNAIDSCGMQIKQKNIKVETESPDDLKAFVNPALLELALVNLIDNAVKYSDAETTIWIECKRDGEQVRIAVMDQGKGIAPEHQSRIFERFYRIERGRSRELGGTGLGLAIVKHIALIHKGRIEVKSEQGRGSEFTIHIPIGTEFSPEA